MSTHAHVRMQYTNKNAGRNSHLAFSIARAVSFASSRCSAVDAPSHCRDGLKISHSYKLVDGLRTSTTKLLALRVDNTDIKQMQGTTKQQLQTGAQENKTKTKKYNNAWNGGLGRIHLAGVIINLH